MKVLRKYSGYIRLTAIIFMAGILLISISPSAVDAKVKPDGGLAHGKSAFAPGHNKIIEPISGQLGSVNPAGNIIGGGGVNSQGQSGRLTTQPGITGVTVSPQGYSIKTAGNNVFVTQPGSNVLVKLNMVTQTAKIGKEKFLLASGDAFSAAISDSISAIELIVPDPIGAKGPNPHHGGTHPKKGDGNPGGGNENNNGHWGEGNNGNGVGNTYTGNQGRGVGEGMAGGRHGDTDTDNDMDIDTDTDTDMDMDMDNDTDLDTDLDNDTDLDTDLDNDTDDDTIEVPALPRRENVQFGGCPALMKWLANELGTPEADIQVFISNTFALSSKIYPCQTCAKLQSAAAVLDDADGKYLAALQQVLNEFIAPNSPITEEQMVLIVSTISEHSGDDTHYAAAGEYLDSLAGYIGVLTEEMGFSTEQAVTLLNTKHSPTTDDAGLTSFVEARIAAIRG